MHKKHFLSPAINTGNTDLRGGSPASWGLSPRTPSRFLCQTTKIIKTTEQLQNFAKRQPQSEAAFNTYC